MWPPTLSFAAPLLLALLALARAEGHYHQGELVPLWANKIGPFSNPTETYEFFDALDWCRPEKLEHRKLNMGEALQGDRLVKTDYQMPFNESSDATKVLCKMKLGVEGINKFVDAIKQRFVYDLLLDDLPMRLFVGEMSSTLATGDTGVTRSRFYVYTHIDFLVAVNGDQIIEASASPGFPVEVEVPDGGELEFEMSYGLRWEQTDFPYSRRSDKYKDPHHYRDIEIHWFSVLNTLISVLVLVIFLASVLARFVRQDVRLVTRGAGAEDGDEGDDSKEIGWKMLHGDVFRLPEGLDVLCPILGAGAQLLLLCGLLLLLGVFELFHPLQRGTLHMTTLVLYLLTSFVSGFVSGHFYKGLGGSQWMRNALITVVIFSGPAFVVGALLNLTAVIYRSTRAIPWWVSGVILGLWCLVTFPLTIVGAILGKNFTRLFEAPHKSAKLPRQIPDCAWYRTRTALFFMAGAMPFSSIFLEIYYIFGALWGYKIFAVYEMLAIFFAILLMVVSITTVAAIYFQLAAEDYRWWWASIADGGCVGLYLLTYSVYYYVMESPLRGPMQFAFFFGSIGMASYALFLMCGTVGFLVSRRFVFYIFSAMKGD